MKKALIVSNQTDMIYSPETIERIGEKVNLLAPPKRDDVLKTDPDLLSEAEIIMSGWGGPRLDEAFFKGSPQLKAFFYGAGSLRGLVTDTCWERELVICSAWEMNAIPVAEFALAQIILALKQVFICSREMCEQRTHFIPSTKRIHGTYRATVGLISLGAIGKRLSRRLQTLDVKVLAYDPFASEDDAAELGLELTDLDSIFREADVVSLHTPWLEETENMIQGRHFRMMKADAAFINTARGAVVDEAAMIEALNERPDLFALLDVTHPEHPAKDSPLWSMKNVFLTPHIAGSQGRECLRMGDAMCDELERYLQGEPLLYQIDGQKFARMA
ncbi:hydroxyacid dehydrogenase [Candidatus Sumerlaeota bacterium]|nr:hydroxyacid dehydrogenase [Candidatus Sumerlaeota bacterium]